LIIPLNDLARTKNASAETIGVLSKVLESGCWINGPEQRAFEVEFANYLGVAHFLGVASGTDAIEIALRALGCTLGSKIVTVANAGAYTTVAAKLIGCEVIYCDVDPETLVMNVESLSNVLSSEIDVVVVTHLYGNIAPVIKIKDVCDRFGVKIIEDCAQAAGGTIDGRRVGSIGNIGTYSFYPTKNLGGCGDGGGLSTNELHLAHILSKLRQYGWGEKYNIQLPNGRNSRLDEIQAAILRLNLEDLDERNQRRRSILCQYSEALAQSGIKLVTNSSAQSAAHLAILKFPNKVTRDLFRAYMSSKGIATEIHYPIIDVDQVAYRQEIQVSSLLNSKAAVDLIVTIPLFPQMTGAEVAYIASALRQF
jgi:dTDP-4-amino-4,6-dideoxygalactose transaminase